MTTERGAIAPALSLRGVTVMRARRTVLDVEAFDVARGEVVALLGPNGAGKSTLLLAAALLLPASGEIRLLGETPTRRNRVHLRRQMAVVFQDSALLDMSARANVETALRLRGIPSGQRREIADEWLRRLAVAHRAEARVHQLSGGEAQRVSLARAFAVRPQLLFLDEPFASLDAITRSALVGDVRRLLADEGTATLITTHDRAEAELLADRVVVMLDGRIVQQGPSAEVLAHPATADVARFLGFSVVHADVASRLVGAELARTSVAAISPAAVRLVPDGLEGPVTEVRGAPAGAEVIVDVGAPLALWLPIGELRERSIEVGRRLSVAIDPERITWL